MYRAKQIFNLLSGKINHGPVKVNVTTEPTTSIPTIDTKKAMHLGKPKAVFKP